MKNLNKKADAQEGDVERNVSTTETSNPAAAAVSAPEKKKKKKSNVRSGLLAFLIMKSIKSFKQESLRPDLFFESTGVNLREFDPLPLLLRLLQYLAKDPLK